MICTMPQALSKKFAKLSDAPCTEFIQQQIQWELCLHHHEDGRGQQGGEVPVRLLRQELRHPEQGNNDDNDDDNDNDDNDNDDV